MLTRKDLRVYQNRSVDFLKKNKCAGLFLDMGLGKTVSTLTALADLLKDGKVKRILVIAPRRVAEGVWRQEARKWGHLQHLTFKLLMGSEPKRLLALRSSAQIHIINVDNARWLFQVLASQRKKNGWPYDMLVIDESSMFKTPGSKRFMTIRHHLRKFDRRVILTGTPAPKGLLDLWAQVYLLDCGERLGEQVSRYRSRFFSPSGYMGYGHKPDEDAEQKIMSLISPLVLAMRAEDWLDLPEVIEQNIWVDLPPRARSLYEKLEKEMFLELESGSTEALSAASLSSKCWQLANGAIYLDTPEGERTWQAVHDAKLEALKEIVDGVAGNMMIAYWFKPDLARLRSLYPKAPCIADCKNDKELQRMTDQWNDGKHPVLLIHPQGGGHGLNLQGGGSDLTFFSMLWGREAFAQVKERMGAARQVGLRDHVNYRYILARRTVDEVMLATQKERHSNERRAIKLLRDYRDIKEILA